MEDILQNTAIKSTGISKIKKAASKAGIEVAEMRGQGVTNFISDIDDGENLVPPKHYDEPPRDANGLHVVTFNIKDIQTKDPD
ncbi:hypothetical protein [Terasakiella pusilla]|uniref:hypothetical protein n=1 Tax=Terasakiella pusilla TaxID=64973 RepID=UPI00048D8356|nr:hypothetical protein [Terasakiella pusilla]